MSRCPQPAQAGGGGGPNAQAPSDTLLTCLKHQITNAVTAGLKSKIQSLNPLLAAFRSLHAFPQERAARLAHLVLLRAMPALAEEDLASFGAAVGEIQRTVGDHFAAAQGGRFASPAVAEVLAWRGTNSSIETVYSRR